MAENFRRTFQQLVNVWAALPPTSSSVMGTGLVPLVCLLNSWYREQHILINLNPKTAEDTLALVATRQIDSVQLRLWAKLTPGERMVAEAQAQAFAMAAVRRAFVKKFPELTQAELNRKINLLDRRKIQ